ncbi:PQQ-like domain-containing protein [Sphingomonas laterariae]|uniref:PQQ-like domain-containing protein n=1 Tax=Edaphosphingomonas laterariae TaxID=861865 RepID=A0A239FBU8_9SPHN|nr:PQQ-like beta-propeller repeat protein [Sphingomonas laterariae]SNS54396.1 PQQ-like domain-containing protein [Sphingomonas laterariae]
MKRVLIAGVILASLSGCGVFKKTDKPKTAVLGERTPVLTYETGAEIDASIADVPVAVPGAAINDAWAQPGGNAAKTMSHLALGETLSVAWKAHIDGSSKRARLAAAPVVADGKLFVMDIAGRVHAFDAASGRELWSREIGQVKTAEGKEKKESQAGRVIFGGGVSFEGGKLYATTGLGDVAVLDAQTGDIGWVVRPAGPLRGAPTLANGHVYVVSQDNQLFALKLEDGSVVWTEAGTLEQAGVFGVAAPAAAAGTVVAGFSSGELNAYRYENGRGVWQDALSRTSISTAVASLSDIDADPVIDQGRVYAVGQGGRMVAMELNTGQRLWELSIAGISTPWVAGEWIFVVTDDARLLCIARTSGKVRWITQLDRWRNAKDKKGPISWTGPVLGGNRLILASTDGALVNVNPTDGTVLSTGKAGGPVFLPPVIANQTLFVLAEDGTLTAWR